MRAGLRLGYGTARHRAGAARAHTVREGIHGRQPRSCAVAAPAVPRRRVAALRAGFAQSARLAWLLARTYLQPRWHAGRLGGAGRPGAPAARPLTAHDPEKHVLDPDRGWEPDFGKDHAPSKINMKRSFAAFTILISLSAAALAASGKQPAPPGSFPGAPPQYTRFSTAALIR